MSVALTALATGMFTNFVNASVPSSAGVISACYRTSGGDLRVRDADIAADTCSNKETAISWSQTGPASEPLAYIYSEYNPATVGHTLDTNRSKNVINFVDFPGAGTCLQVNFVPHNILSDADASAVRDGTGWFGRAVTDAQNLCDNIAGANVYVDANRSESIQVL